MPLERADPYNTRVVHAPEPATEQARDLVGADPVHEAPCRPSRVLARSARSPRSVVLPSHPSTVQRLFSTKHPSWWIVPHSTQATRSGSSPETASWQ